MSKSLIFLIPFLFGPLYSGKANNNGIKQKDTNITPLHVPFKSTVFLSGPMNLKQVESTLGHLGKIPLVKGLKINILINSQGGLVDGGKAIERSIWKLRGFGVLVDCIVDGQAYSAAFYLLMACDNRYVTSRSYLLFHQVRMAYSGVLVDEQELEADLKELKKSNQEYIRLLITHLRNEALIIQHYYKETEWTVPDFKAAFPGFIQEIESVKFTQ